MAKAPKNTASAEPIDAEAELATTEAQAIPAPLAAAAEENDPVLQAHFIRQQNHFNDLAPSIAKQARADLEREEMLREHELIAERNRKAREAAEREQAEREERENAAANLEATKAEMAALEEALKSKKAEADRLAKMVKE